MLTDSRSKNCQFFANNLQLKFRLNVNENCGRASEQESEKRKQKAHNKARKVQAALGWDHNCTSIKVTIVISGLTFTFKNRCALFHVLTKSQNTFAEHSVDCAIPLNEVIQSHRIANIWIRRLEYFCEELLFFFCRIRWEFQALKPVVWVREIGVKMKLFGVSLAVSVILAGLVFGVNTLPYPEPQAVPQTVTLPSPFTADAMNNGIAFTQSFMQLLNLFLANFNTMIPKFVELFTSTGPNLAALPSVPGIPSLTAMQPGKINSPPADNSIVPRDVELLDNVIANAANQIPVWMVAHHLAPHTFVLFTLSAHQV